MGAERVGEASDFLLGLFPETTQPSANLLGDRTRGHIAPDSDTEDTSEVLPPHWPDNTLWAKGTAEGLIPSACCIAVPLGNAKDVVYSCTVHVN